MLRISFKEQAAVAGVSGMQPAWGMCWKDDEAVGFYLQITKTNIQLC